MVAGFVTTKTNCFLTDSLKSERENYGQFGLWWILKAEWVGIFPKKQCIDSVSHHLWPTRSIWWCVYLQRRCPLPGFLFVVFVLCSFFWLLYPEAAGIYSEDVPPMAPYWLHKSIWCMSSFLSGTVVTVIEKKTSFLDIPWVKKHRKPKMGWKKKKKVQGTAGWKSHTHTLRPSGLHQGSMPTHQQDTRHTYI